MNTTLRNTIKTLDSILFAGLLRKLNRNRLKDKLYNQKKVHISKIQKTYKYNSTVCFTSKKQNILDELFDKYKSDKGSATYKILTSDDREGNYYHDIYDLLFFQHRKQTKIVLECGIGCKNPETPSNMSWSRHSIPGGSLRAWRDYFPNANIIGIDIDPDVIFTENRINTYVCDQTSKLSIKNFITKANLQPRTLDIIIDDGLHEFNANITLFENTKHLLKNNGIYIIEDFHVVNPDHQFIDYFNNLYGYDFKFIDSYFGGLIVVTKHD